MCLPERAAPHRRNVRASGGQPRSEGEAGGPSGLQWGLLTQIPEVGDAAHFLLDQVAPVKIRCRPRGGGVMTDILPIAVRAALGLLAILFAPTVDRWAERLERWVNGRLRAWQS